MRWARTETGESSDAFQDLPGHVAPRKSNAPHHRSDCRCETELMGRKEGGGGGEKK